jgi:hypothetical protein
MGRDLDMISRGLRAKIPVNISEGKLRPEEPLQAAKLASEAGIILRDHVPIFTHWKHYKEDAAKPLVRNYNDKLSVSNLAAEDNFFGGLWITIYFVRNYNDKFFWWKNLCIFPC